MSARVKSKPLLVTPYGVPYVSVSTTLKRNFARQCLITMTIRDGRDHGWKLFAMKSIDVPADVVEATRARLQRERGRHSNIDDEGTDD